MSHLVFKSKLTELLCSSNVTAQDLPPHVPAVHPAYLVVCYLFGGLMIIGSVAIASAGRIMWSRTHRLSNAVIMLSTSTATCWFYGVFYILGGGVHRPGDLAMRNAGVYALFTGAFALNVSTVFWNESKHNLTSFSSIPAHRQRRQKRVLRAASLLPMASTTLYSYIVVWMESYDCLPLVTIFRICAVGTFLVVATCGPLNYYYLRKSVKSLEWMREQSSRDPAKSAQLSDTINKVKRQSGTIVASGPPNLASAAIIVVLPYLEDVPWFYALIMSLQAVTIFACTGNTFIVFYWNKASRSSTTKASPSAPKTTSKANSKVSPTGQTSRQMSPSNAIQSNFTEKESVSSTGF